MESIMTQQHSCVKNSKPTISSCVQQRTKHLTILITLLSNGGKRRRGNHFVMAKFIMFKLKEDKLQIYRGEADFSVGFPPVSAGQAKAVDLSNLLYFNAVGFSSGQSKPVISFTNILKPFT